MHFSLDKRSPSSCNVVPKVLPLPPRHHREPFLDDDVVAEEKGTESSPVISNVYSIPRCNPKETTGDESQRGPWNEVDVRVNVREGKSAQLNIIGKAAEIQCVT